MSTFTSTLPDDLLKLLNEQASKLSIPKNKLIEKALRIYLDQLNRAEYIRSYKELAADTDLLSIAEEGMEDYLQQIEK
ncbi:MAG: ribbon-helix-helix domain-containing protein [Crocinitomicaceae bacterium]|mgnify:CR=1 FL=1|jgi:predicted transcriptional regulator|nr:ribbon-helix-helix domain-containing protein [Crocinitomicaceae bacterium]MCF8434334.1 ribbon-helix-helix domain-containing protein [Crocinitomicaceae bacterium]MDP4684320.1 ribbon-helix-helix domain-containing protein [Crocinitomicaceae bacterium]MDP4866604.1 ribbon-helix-helix domain-containing protein [Crocinitomicaceae bacterium]MDP5011457.1 ribbon-helix-helix domain-containing protein [Crocinitomicaceae bacterium]